MLCFELLTREQFALNQNLIESNKDIIIIGDVNQGATVTSKGNIIVSSGNKIVLEHLKRAEGTPASAGGHHGGQPQAQEVLRQSEGPV